MDPKFLIIGVIVAIAFFLLVRDTIAQKGAEMTVKDAKQGRIARNIVLIVFAAIGLLLYYTFTAPSNRSISDPSLDFAHRAALEAQKHPRTDIPEIKLNRGEPRKADAESKEHEFVLRREPNHNKPSDSETREPSSQPR